MNKPINWNEVKVGETEIALEPHHRIKVVGLWGNFVWGTDRSGNFYSYSKDHLADWTIDDPWVEISDQCEWKQLEMSRHLWKLFYQGRPLFIDDVNTKSDGRRVWVRKEG